MNPYDFYSLDDFLEFSPLSPNYANLNMVSSPRFRPPRIRSAFAIVPLPEDSSIAYHKEIYTVLFDPPSFLMVYSIVCHLWKKSKMEKKFLPLPPVLKPLQQLQTNSSIASTMDEDIDFTILEKSNFEFTFGSFGHKSGMEIEQVIPIKTIKPLIEGGSIKIGELDCFLSTYETESVCNQKTLGLEYQEHISDSTIFVSDSALDIEEEILGSESNEKTLSESVIAILKDLTNPIPNRLVFAEFRYGLCGYRSGIYFISVMNRRLLSMFLSLPPEKKVVSTATAMITFPLDSSTFSFDPGGTLIKTYYFTVMLSFLSKLISIYFIVRVFVFDPGGNHNGFCS
ncbi:hypothetical protein QL285_008237 [Trifolium repens]|nr:hypothetical protein QL285_008237 [Trifolium repens]